MNVLIYGEDGRRIDSYCRGPTWSGQCPAVAAGDPVRCAGQGIRVTNRARTARLELLVEQAATVCPIAALNGGGLFFDYTPSRPATLEHEPQRRNRTRGGDTRSRNVFREWADLVGFFAYLAAVQAVTWEPRLLRAVRNS